MRETALIAWREYKQYVFSRGFILLIALAPIGLFALAFLMGALENSIPQRHYMIIDQSDKNYADQVEDYVGRLEDQRVIAAWDQFVTINQNVELGEESDIPEPFAPDALSAQRLHAFRAKGGVEAAKRTAEPFLRVDPENFIPPRARYKRHPLPEPLRQAAQAKKFSADQYLDYLRPYLLDEKSLPVKGEGGDGVTLFAVLIIPADFGEDGKSDAQYWSRNLVDVELKDDFSLGLNRALQLQLAANRGLNKRTYEEIVTSIASLEEFRPDRENEDAALNLKDRIETGLPAVMTYFLFILIFSVGHLLLTNTIEERSNKIVEMLLSSVTANQLMLGKLLGIGAVGLTIPAIGATFALISGLTLFADNQIASQIISSLFLSPLVWVYLFYFLCGYVIFAMMYLAVGAISNSLQDAQTFIGPITLIVLAPLPLMVLVFQDPNGLVASIMTWIPFYTPYAVMLRAASDPPLWEIIGATIFMLVFGGFFIALMGRIFRRGLLSSSPTSLSAFLRLAGSNPKS